jgi:hypothetical protein
MEAIRSSQTSVLTRATRRNISEDGIPHSHHRENLKFYTIGCLVSLEPYSVCYSTLPSALQGHNPGDCFSRRSSVPDLNPGDTISAGDLPYRILVLETLFQEEIFLADLNPGDTVSAEDLLYRILILETLFAGDLPNRILVLETLFQPEICHIRS